MRKFQGIFDFVLMQSGTNFKQGQEIVESHAIGSYDLLVRPNAPVSYRRCGETEVLVLGYVLNLAENGKDFCNLRDVKSIDDLLAQEFEWGGKYVIFFFQKERLYIIPDATSSIPVFCYELQGELVASSNSRRIAEYYALAEDAKKHKVFCSRDIVQAMPFDITEYESVKQLLPNHYFDVNRHIIQRVIIEHRIEKRISVKDACDATIEKIKRLVGFYAESFNIACPITGGYDSRVILAFLIAGNYEFVNYTIDHDKTQKSTDVRDSLIIAERFGLAHRIILDEEVNSDLRKRADVYFGRFKYDNSTLEIANTIRLNYGEYAILQGDIIGQIGKSSLHRNIPTVLATARYFRCKCHNYSCEAITYLNEWIQEIKQSKEKTNIMDLFSVENRLGRWRGQQYLIEHLCGVNAMNIFNSRSIIYAWTRVSRLDRYKCKLHDEYLLRMLPQIREIPYDKGRWSHKLFKSNWMLFYLASWAKYVLEFVKFVYLKRQKR